MTVMAPADENECRQTLYTAFTLSTPAAVRYPRGAGPGVAVEKEMRALPIGRGEIRRRGSGIAILAFGSMVHSALHAAEEFNATVANMRFVKPLDDDLVLQLAHSHELVVTVEENVVHGGAGSAVLECLHRHGLAPEVLQLGLPDRFVEHGDPGILLAEAGLTQDGIAAAIRNKISANTPRISIVTKAKQ